MLCRRKSAGKDENAAAAALGFGKKRSLEKSRGMMEMFVRRAAPKTKPTPKPSIEEEEKPTEAPAETEVCSHHPSSTVRSCVSVLL